MFGKGNRDGDSPAAAYQAGGKRTGFSVIGADVVITGNVQATADLHVEGRIEGDLDCGNLVQGPDSHVKGQVRAASARIAGTIEGSVAIRQLTVESGAHIIGDVEYENVSIQTGAHIDGRMRHMAVGQAVPPALAAPRSMTVVDITAEQAAE
jgi:cytoskeletal protein CcmA (bactofilin family)